MGSIGVAAEGEFLLIKNLTPESHGGDGGRLECRVKNHYSCASRGRSFIGCCSSSCWLERRASFATNYDSFIEKVSTTATINLANLNKLARLREK